MRNILKALSKISIHSVYHFVKNRKKRRRADKEIAQYLQQTAEPKLHIGAGGSVLKGWLNTDFEHLEIGSIYLDASLPFKIADATFSYIYSEHLFEHLNFNGQLNMLMEAYRILKKGGSMRIATPNFDFITSVTPQSNEEYLQWASKRYFPESTFALGKQAVCKEFFVNFYFHNWGHQFIHSPHSLKPLLSFVGFENVRQVKIYESDFEVFKNIETHGKVITEKYNEMETMVFEVIK